MEGIDAVVISGRESPVGRTETWNGYDDRRSARFLPASRFEVPEIYTIRSAPSTATHCRLSRDSFGGDCNRNHVGGVLATCVEFESYDEHQQRTGIVSSNDVMSVFLPETVEPFCLW